MGQLDGKIAIVTGSDSGIGQGIAEELAREGADVAITYLHDKAGAAETMRKIEACGRRAFVTRLDQTDEASVNALFDGGAEALGARASRAKWAAWRSTSLPPTPTTSPGRASQSTVGWKPTGAMARRGPWRKRTDKGDDDGPGRPAADAGPAGAVSQTALPRPAPARAWPCGQDAPPA